MVDGEDDGDCLVSFCSLDGFILQGLSQQVV